MQLLALQDADCEFRSGEGAALSLPRLEESSSQGGDFRLHGVRRASFEEHDRLLLRKSESLDIVGKTPSTAGCFVWPGPDQR